jgi:hypothetical protein
MFNMKMRVLSLLAATMFLTLTTYAQVVLKPHVGANFTNVTITGTDASGQAGALAGLSVAFGKKIYFEPGLQYVAKSTEISSTTNPTFPDNLSLKGLRVPLALGINLLGSEKSVLTLHGFGGLSGFFIMSDNTPSSLDINKANWGLFAGAGVDIWKFFVDVSYEWSLSEVSTNLSNAQIGATRSLFINGGLRINL